MTPVLTEPVLTESEQPTACPACGGPCVLLGTLGHRDHYRCQDCGLEVSTFHPTETPTDPLTEGEPSC